MSRAADSSKRSSVIIGNSNRETTYLKYYFILEKLINQRRYSTYEKLLRTDFYTANVDFVLMKYRVS